MKVVRTSQMQWTDALTRGRYANRRKALGGEKLSCGLWELPPGKKSFPLHVHQITEEALFVISGAAKVRTPDGLTAIGPGDFVSFPAGGPAHQLVNDGEVPLVYLAIGANFVGADIVEYPDTGKTACSIGAFPTGRRMIFKDQTDYTAGDPDAEG